jgi:hypothetical protein
MRVTLRPADGEIHSHYGDHEMGGAWGVEPEDADAGEEDPS